MTEDLKEIEESPAADVVPREEYERVCRERDAVIKEIHKHCYNCKYRGKAMDDMPCNLCHYHDKWEWVGIQNEA